MLSLLTRGASVGVFFLYKKEDVVEDEIKSRKNVKFIISIREATLKLTAWARHSHLYICAPGRVEINTESSKKTDTQTVKEKEKKRSKWRPLEGNVMNRKE